MIILTNVIHLIFSSKWSHFTGCRKVWFFTPFVTDDHLCNSLAGCERLRRGKHSCNILDTEYTPKLCLRESGRDVSLLLAEFLTLQVFILEFLQGEVKYARYIYLFTIDYSIITHN